MYERLAPDYHVTAFFYNPNISPRREYEIRRDELVHYGRRMEFPAIEGEWNIKDWTRAVYAYRFAGERSIRCWQCYRFRLEETFRKAGELGMGTVATVLSISPHKDSVKINEIGRELSAAYGIEFLEADFKKKDGFKRSVEISRSENFYRQNYCGCVYSRLEREKNLRWLEQSRQWQEEQAAINT